MNAYIQAHIQTQIHEQEGENGKSKTNSTIKRMKGQARQQQKNNNS